MGKYNVRDTASLLIVGKDTSDTARFNAYKLDASGNGYYTGSVYVGTNNKKLATEEYVTSSMTAITLDEIDAICGMSIEV